MNHPDEIGPSPVVGFFDHLRGLQPRFVVELGPRAGEGWIAGRALATADEGPFPDLLLEFGRVLATPDRRTIAAAFALRYGWSAGVGIGPFIVHRCVPDIGLDNIVLKFGGAHLLFEKAALIRAAGVMPADAGVAAHPSIRRVADDRELTQWLRRSLIAQAAPVVGALHAWSGFAVKGLWGLVASSWGSQFVNVFGRIGEPRDALEPARRFFAGDDVVARMQPTLYPVTCGDVTHVYHRAAACCRFYLRPSSSYCAMCPLISHPERLRRNFEWMRRQLEAGR